MSITIKKAVLWRTEVSNKPGAMGASLAPLADQGINLDLVMGYTNPDKTLASIEVFPIGSAKAQREARKVGFSKAEFPCVVVQGKNQAGLGKKVASALGEAGINLNFFVAQAIDGEYVGLFSFEAQSEADLAVKVLRSALNNAPASKPSRKPRAKAIR
ncbi:MAG TPA: hypothetical protein VNT79_14915 [Phycisphaerae bacterium]|nr:hypothetical protein [Phycisphaerae bacterium]